MHTFSNVTSTTFATADTKGINVKLSGNDQENVKLNQNILCTYRMSTQAYQYYFWDGLAYQEQTSEAKFFRREN